MVRFFAVLCCSILIMRTGFCKPSLKHQRIAVVEVQTPQNVDQGVTTIHITNENHNHTTLEQKGLRDDEQLCNEHLKTKLLNLKRDCLVSKVKQECPIRLEEMACTMTKLEAGRMFKRLGKTALHDIACVRPHFVIQLTSIVMQQAEMERQARYQRMWLAVLKIMGGPSLW